MESKAVMMMSAAAPLVACALYSGLVTTRYKIYSRHIKGPLTLLLLADLHSTRYGQRQEYLIERIRAEKPDLILMAGDMVDERRSFGPVLDLAKALCPIAPVYYASGNHEYRVININMCFQKLRGLGVKVLTDHRAFIEIKGEYLCISGVRDPDYARQRPAYTQTAALERLSEGLIKNDGVYKILLAHRPELFSRYARYPYDLVLSGHAHGGQVRIPFADVGLYSHSKIFPKYTSGLHSLGDTDMVVSRGLSRFLYLPRVFNPPELVAITLSHLPVA